MGSWLRRAAYGSALTLAFLLATIVVVSVTVVVITLLAQGIAYTTGFPERVSGLLAFLLGVSIVGGCVAATLLEGD